MWSDVGIAARWAQAFALVFSFVNQSAAEGRPNVVLVITDDQGYGDVGTLGNRMIRTPNLDRLHGQSVRLTDFHVDPTCAPTRSALMTGRYSSRSGVWHTIMGRSIMRRDEVTLPQILAAAGYQTAMFGKWHLGDTPGYRPQDRGFQQAFMHGGGGVTQTPDYWDNDYFDDTYLRNGQPEKTTGYCTDVWFNNALEFIRANRARPFFCYIATNAPHGPYLVEERYSKPYADQGVPETMAKFYGMIENMDDNLGRLTAQLDELGLAENTVLIFMTDNGTAAGVDKAAPGRKARPAAAGAWPGFNAGMRGQKGAQYEGGHRVPCFIRYPGAKWETDRDVDQLTAHIDLLPTLLDLCGVAPPDGVPLDGRSVRTLLAGASAWPERTITVHSQRIEHPEKWKTSAVMTERYRLVDGKELYDIVADPGQQTDIAARNATLVEQLRAEYEAWWTSISTRFDQYVPIILGGSDEVVSLTCHDWHGNDLPPWSQELVRKNPWSNGYWAIEAARAGRYRFTLRQRPEIASFPIEGTTARLVIGDREATAAIPSGATSLTLELDLPAGAAEMRTYFTADEQSRGAFFVDVERLP